MDKLKTLKIFLIIFPFLLISSLFFGCQHIIQLPKPVKIEQGTNKAEMLKTLDEITDKVSDGNSLPTSAFYP